MTQTWESPAFSEGETSIATGVEPPNTFDTLVTDGEIVGANNDDDTNPLSLLTKVLEITKARNVAAQLRFKEQQLAAADEVEETIGALVDLLAELDYPGATIVNGLEGSPKRNDYQIEREQVVQIPLWLLDIPVENNVLGWGFGPDKILYAHKKYSARLYESASQTYTCYVKVDIRDDIDQVFKVRDALDRFPLPTEDSLLQ